MQDFLDGFKDFGLWLLITHLGRAIIGIVLLFVGGILIEGDKTSVPFYIGLVLFGFEASVMFFHMAWNLIKEYL